MSSYIGNIDNLDYAIFTSFYTIGTGYEKEVQNLIHSIQQLNLPYHIEGIESFGKWEHNCAYKPTHIEKIMNIYPERCVVWVDADCTIETEPELFRNKSNVQLKSVGCYIMKDYHRDKKRTQLISGTIFFRNDLISKNIVKLWIEGCNKDKDVWDQVVLHKIYNEQKVYFGNLPAGYNKIFDKMVHKKVVPIIQHWQASRRFKRQINDGP